MKLLTANQILDYIYYQIAKHRATLAKLKEQGRSYRTREVTIIIARINTLNDLRDTITEPQHTEDLKRALGLLKDKG